MRATIISSFFTYYAGLGFPLVALAIQAGDFWSDVTSLDAYSKVPVCAQSCVRDVNSVTNCVDYSCVCSDHSVGGTNFITSATTISGCAERLCPDQASANAAVNIFRNICLAARSNLTELTGVNTTATATQTGTGLPPSPAQTSGASHLFLIKPVSYQSLNPCSKFSLNSCRDSNGTVNELDCGTDNRPDGVDSYKGLADELSCANSACLCAGGAFNLTFWRLYQDSASFCGYLPTTSDQDYPEYDRLQGALADYCSSQNFTPTGYSLPIIGKDNPSGLNTSDKIALGVGVGALGLALIALCFQGVSTYTAWRTYRG